MILEKRAAAFRKDHARSIEAKRDDGSTKSYRALAVISQSGARASTRRTDVHA
jgi:hypothetical protein